MVWQLIFVFKHDNGDIYKIEANSYNQAFKFLLDETNIDYKEFQYLHTERWMIGLLE